MAYRSGMYDLIEQLRYMIDDADITGYVISDNRLAEILDGNRVDFYQQPLVVTPQQVAAGTVAYHVYTAAYGNLEGTASGTAAFRLYDSHGSVITSGYTADMQRGVFTFTADQAGSARYVDGRSYDLNAAAAEGWRQRAAKQASGYDFRVEGRQYSRAQWFAHCRQMASMYAGQARPSTAVIERGDMVC